MSLALYRRLLQYVKPYRGRIVAAVGCMAVHAAVMVGSMYMIKRVFDDILVNPNKSEAVQYLGVVVGGLVGLYMVKGIFQYMKDYLIINAGQKVVMDLRNQLYQHLQNLSLGFYTRERTGSLIHTVTNDTANVQGAVSNVFGTLIDSVITVGGLAGYLLYLNWRLALIGFLVFPLAISVLYRFGRR